MAAAPTTPILKRLRGSRPALFLCVGVAFASLANRMLAEAFGYRGSPVWLDLDVYRRGVGAWLAGEPIAGPFWIDYARASFPFTYPPIAAVLMLPVVGGSLPVVGAVWTLASGVVLGLCLFLLARWSQFSPGDALLLSLFVLAVAVNLEPVVNHLGLGQIGIFLMGLVVVDLTIPWKRWPRGLLTGLAIAVKLAPAVFVLFFLLRKDWRGLATTVASAVGFTLVGLLAAPRDSMAFWSGIGALDRQVVIFDWVSNTSLRGVLQRLPIGNDLAVWISLIVGATLLAVLAMRSALGAESPASALVANGLLMPLITPTAWGHHWVWLAGLLMVAVMGAVRGSAVMGALALGTALIFRETGLDGSVPGSWLMYPLWGILALVALAMPRTYPCSPTWDKDVDPSVG